MVAPTEIGNIIVAENTNKDESEANMESMIRSITGRDKKFQCKVCGKSDKHEIFVKSHVESHFEGVAHVCALCGKTSRSKMGLIKHHTRTHK